MLLAIGAVLASGHGVLAARLCAVDFVFAASSPDPARHFTKPAALAGAIRNWRRAARTFMPTNLHGDWYRATHRDSACNRVTGGRDKGFYWSCEVKAKPCWDTLQ